MICCCFWCLCCTFAQFWRFWNRMMIYLFFSDVKVVGPQVPYEEPVLYSATHWNGLVDTQMLYCFMPKAPRLIAKDTLLHVPILGTAGRMAKVIPVFRKADQKNKKEANPIVQTQKEGPIEDLSPRMSPPAMGPPDPTAPEPASSESAPAGTGSGNGAEEAAADAEAPPATKQDYTRTMFRAVLEALAEPAPANTVTIFPEGMSHDMPHQLEIKPGVAMIALASCVEDGVPLKMQVVATESLAKHLFRTHMHLTFGTPFTIPEDIQQSHRENKHRGRDNPATSALAEHIRNEFLKISCQAEDWVQKNRAFLARKLFQPDSRSMSLLDRYYDMEFFRCACDFTRVLRTMPDDEAVGATVHALAQYQQALDAAAVSDAAVVRFDGCGASFLYGSLWLPVAVLVTAIGVGPWIYFMPFCCLGQLLTNMQVTGYIAAGKKVWKEQPDDYEAMDVHNTYFQLMSYPLCNILFLTYSIVVAILCRRAFCFNIDDCSEDAAGAISWFVLFFIVPYILGAIAVLCLDWAAKTWYAVGAHYAACCGKAAALEKLKTQRAEVQQLVRSLLLAHGPAERLGSDEYKEVQSLAKTGAAGAKAEDVEQSAAPATAELQIEAGGEANENRA